MAEPAVALGFLSGLWHGGRHSPCRRAAPHILAGSSHFVAFVQALKARQTVSAAHMLRWYVALHSSHLIDDILADNEHYRGFALASQPRRG